MASPIKDMSQFQIDLKQVLADAEPETVEEPVVKPVDKPVVETPPVAKPVDPPVAETVVPKPAEPDPESDFEEEEEEEMVDSPTQPCPVLKRDVFPQPVKAPPVTLAPTPWAPYLAVSGLLCVGLCVWTLKKGSPSQPKPPPVPQPVTQSPPVTTDPLAVFFS
jgi:hypothetical protein